MEPPDPLRSAIARFRDGPDEMTPVVNVYAGHAPAVLESEPPGRETQPSISIRLPMGARLRIGSGPGWLFATVVTLAIIGGVVWVLTH